VPARSHIRKVVDYKMGCKQSESAVLDADVCWRMLTYADICWRMLTYADVCWRMLTYADVCWSMLTQSEESQIAKNEKEKMTLFELELMPLCSAMSGASMLTANIPSPPCCEFSSHKTPTPQGSLYIYIYMYITYIYKLYLVLWHALVQCCESRCAVPVHTRAIMYR
jgi:hypothetical protein